MLRDCFGLKDARRGVQYCGSPNSPDVVGGFPGTHAEVKRVERYTPHDWIEQAAKDAGLDEVPYIAHRQNGKPWLITVKVEDLKKFVDRLKQ